MFKNEKQTSEQIWFNLIYSMINDSIKDISNFREFKKNENLELGIELSNNIDKNEINILISFVRNRIKFVVEKWTFTIIKNNEKGNIKFINTNKMHKKLLMMKKSIKFLLKFLPLYELYKIKDEKFNFKLELEVEINKNNLKIDKDESESITLEPLNDIFGIFNLNIEYIMKNKIFQIEDKLKNMIFQEDSEIRSKYLFSDDNNNNNKSDDESDKNSSKSDDNIDFCEKERKEIEYLTLNKNDISFDDEEENESSFEDVIICFEDKKIDNNFNKDNYYENDDLFDFGQFDENQNKMENNDDDIPLMSEVEVINPLKIIKSFDKLKHSSNFIFINNKNLNSLVNT